MSTSSCRQRDEEPPVHPGHAGHLLQPSAEAQYMACVALAHRSVHSFVASDTNTDAPPVKQE